MSKTVSLTAKDGHTLSAYEAGGPASGAALVILQEIFGVNRHIRSVADAYAREGFYTIAPALFDRVQKGVDLDYTPEGIEIARGLASRIDQEAILKDIESGITHARRRTVSGKVGVVGYCLGGSYAWLSATRLKPDAAVGYYGSKVAPFIAETPVAPVILHFGNQDRGIPLSDVEKIKRARPELPVYIYDAGHGFNCDERAGYSEPAASLAFSRTLKFLRETLLV